METMYKLLVFIFCLSYLTPASARDLEIWRDGTHLWAKTHRLADLKPWNPCYCGSIDINKSSQPEIESFLKRTFPDYDQALIKNLARSVFTFFYDLNYNEVYIDLDHFPKFIQTSPDILD